MMEAGIDFEFTLNDFSSVYCCIVFVAVRRHKALYCLQIIAFFGGISEYIHPSQHFACCSLPTSNSLGVGKYRPIK